MNFNKLFTPLPDNSIILCSSSTLDSKVPDLQILSVLRGCSNVLCLDNISWGFCRQHKLSSKSEKMIKDDSKTISLVANASASNGFSTAVLVSDLFSKPHIETLINICKRAHDKDLQVLAPLSDSILLLLQSLCTGLDSTKNNSMIKVAHTSAENAARLLRKNEKSQIPCKWALAFKDNDCYEILTSMNIKFHPDHLKGLGQVFLALI